MNVTVKLALRMILYAPFYKINEYAITHYNSKTFFSVFVKKLPKIEKFIEKI